MILSGLAAIYEIPREGAYLERTESIADAVLKELTSPPSARLAGILNTAVALAGS